MGRYSMMIAVLGLILVWGSGVQADIVIDTVTVGNAGNAGELSGGGAGGYGPDRVCGAVDYTYNIGKYEVTAGQYTAFLNAVAATDTYGLYKTSMWASVYGCKIERTGSSGSYAYSVAPDRANRPVNYVSFWDSCRFANWLHNGQPSGAQGPGTTETGGYTLNGYTGGDGREIKRHPDWNWAVTTEDEWYKAAYHKNDGVTGEYWDYPTSSDSVPGFVDQSGDLSGTGDPFIEGGTDPGNYATFEGDAGGMDGIGYPYHRTEGGEWENSYSPYGTFDQGGNVWEWNESVVAEGSGWSFRGMRGGSYLGDEDVSLFSLYRAKTRPATTENSYVGFRVVMLPEPGCLALVVLGGAMVLRRRGLGR